MSNTPRTDAFIADDNGDPADAYEFMSALERGFAAAERDRDHALASRDAEFEAHRMTKAERDAANALASERYEKLKEIAETLFQADRVMSQAIGQVTALVKERDAERDNALLLQRERDDARAICAELVTDSNAVTLAQTVFKLTAELDTLKGKLYDLINLTPHMIALADTVDYAPGDFKYQKALRDAKEAIQYVEP